MFSLILLLQVFLAVTDYFHLLTRHQVSDEKVQGDKNAKTPEKYYDILNIYGYRLTKHPNVKVKVTGCNDDVSAGEKGDMALSEKRAQVIFNYLKNVWHISEDRLTLEKEDYLMIK